MMNEELIAKIKSEIERLKGIGGIVPLDNREQKTGYESALIDIEIFLDSLEAKYKVRNPIFDKCVANVDPEVMEEVSRIIDIENELVRFYLKDLCGSEKDEISEATLHNNFPIMWDDLRDIARHFAKWGAEHAKNEEEL